jgi:hypothetical protein
MLKPCPFCGSRDIKHYAHPLGRRFKCCGCRAEGPPARIDTRGTDAAETYRMRTEEAATLWNGRTHALSN